MTWVRVGAVVLLETQLCKLRVIPRSCVLRGVYDTMLIILEKCRQYIFPPHNYSREVRDLVPTKNLIRENPWKQETGDGSIRVCAVPQCVFLFLFRDVKCPPARATKPHVHKVQPHTTGPTINTPYVAKNKKQNKRQNKNDSFISFVVRT